MAWLNLKLKGENEMKEAWKNFWKPKYRIVTDRYVGYEVQVRCWPFWTQLSLNSNSSIEDAEKWFLQYKEKQSRKIEVVKYL